MVSRNSIDWAVFAYAGYAVGAAVVPMYENQDPSDWQHVVHDSGARLLLCSPFPHHRLLNMRNSGLFPAGLQLASFAEMRARMPQQPPQPPKHDALCNSDDTCSIIYTSGTSGKPKGVELTHGNITSNVFGVAYLFEHVYGGKRCLSFLPWAHAYAQTVELHSSIAVGSQIAICSGLEYLRQNLVDAKPFLLFSVPSLFEKIYAGINANVAKQSPLKQRLFHAAVNVAKVRARKVRRGQDLHFFAKLRYLVLNKLVLSKIRAALGPNLEIAVNGGAKLDTNIMEFFEALGLTVFEGYGLTETSPILAANHPFFRREGERMCFCPAFSMFLPGFFRNCWTSFAWCRSHSP